MQGVQALLAHEPLIASINERHEAIEAAATQRLSWATGANPTVGSAVTANNKLLINKNSMSLAMQALEHIAPGEDVYGLAQSYTRRGVQTNHVQVRLQSKYCNPKIPFPQIIF